MLCLVEYEIGKSIFQPVFDIVSCLLISHIHFSIYDSFLKENQIILQPSIPVSSSKSRTYFLWEIWPTLFQENILGSRFFHFKLLCKPLFLILKSLVYHLLLQLCYPHKQYCFNAFINKV